VKEIKRNEEEKERMKERRERKGRRGEKVVGFFFFGAQQKREYRQGTGLASRRAGKEWVLLVYRPG
jgi:hypothetical protein